MSRNVIKFDPKARKQKRASPTPLRRLREYSRASIILILVGVGFAAYWMFGGSPSESDTSLAQISGTASVIDGDTIEIHGDRIRLSGFDAPESGRMCGRVNVYQKASMALSDLIGRRTVVCDTREKDRYNRYVATCEVGGQGLGEYMVAQGWA